MPHNRTIPSTPQSARRFQAQCEMWERYEKALAARSNLLPPELRQPCEIGTVAVGPRAGRTYIGISLDETHAYYRRRREVTR